MNLNKGTVMIQVKCFTNIDAFKQCNWPEKFCMRPMIGDSVQELGGKRSLRICNITHCESDHQLYAYLKIELTGMHG